MHRTSWRGADIVFMVVILAFACVAAYLSVRLTRPRPIANAGFGLEWQCSRTLGILTVCSRTAHDAASPQAVPKDDLAV
jgi:hypothetical protein